MATPINQLIQRQVNDILSSMSDTLEALHAALTHSETDVSALDSQIKKLRADLGTLKANLNPIQPADIALEALMNIFDAQLGAIQEVSMSETEINVRLKTLEEELDRIRFTINTYLKKRQKLEELKTNVPELARQIQDSLDKGIPTEITTFGPHYIKLIEEKIFREGSTAKISLSDFLVFLKKQATERAIEIYNASLSSTGLDETTQKIEYARNILQMTLDLERQFSTIETFLLKANLSLGHEEHDTVQFSLDDLVGVGLINIITSAAAIKRLAISGIEMPRDHFWVPAHEISTYFHVYQSDHGLSTNEYTRKSVSGIEYVDIYSLFPVQDPALEIGGIRADRYLPSDNSIKPGQIYIPRRKLVELVLTFHSIQENIAVVATRETDEFLMEPTVERSDYVGLPPYILSYIFRGGDATILKNYRRMLNDSSAVLPEEMNYNEFTQFAKFLSGRSDQFNKLASADNIYPWLHTKIPQTLADQIVSAVESGSDGTFFQEILAVVNSTEYVAPRSYIKILSMLFDENVAYPDDISRAILNSGITKNNTDRLYEVRVRIKVFTSKKYLVKKLQSIAQELKKQGEADPFKTRTVLKKFIGLYSRHSHVDEVVLMIEAFQEQIERFGELPIDAFISIQLPDRRGDGSQSIDNFIGMISAFFSSINRDVERDDLKALILNNDNLKQFRFVKSGEVKITSDGISQIMSVINTIPYVSITEGRGIINALAEKLNQLVPDVSSSATDIIEEVKDEDYDIYAKFLDLDFDGMFDIATNIFHKLKPVVDILMALAQESNFLAAQNREQRLLTLIGPNGLLREALKKACFEVIGDNKNAVQVNTSNISPELVKDIVEWLTSHNFKDVNIYRLFLVSQLLNSVFKSVQYEPSMLFEVSVLTIIDEIAKTRINYKDVLSSFDKKDYEKVLDKMTDGGDNFEAKYKGMSGDEFKLRVLGEGVLSGFIRDMMSYLEQESVGLHSELTKKKIGEKVIEGYRPFRTILDVDSPVEWLYKLINYLNFEINMSGGKVINPANLIKGLFIPLSADVTELTYELVLSNLNAAFNRVRDFILPNSETRQVSLWEIIPELLTSPDAVTPALETHATLDASTLLFDKYNEKLNQMLGASGVQIDLSVFDPNLDDRNLELYLQSMVAVISHFHETANLDVEAYTSLDQVDKDLFLSALYAILPDRAADISQALNNTSSIEVVDAETLTLRDLIERSKYRLENIFGFVPGSMKLSGKQFAKGAIDLLDLSVDLDAQRFKYSDNPQHNNLNKLIHRLLQHIFIEAFQAGSHQLAIHSTQSGVSHTQTTVVKIGETYTIFGTKNDILPKIKVSVDRRKGEVYFEVLGI